MNIISRAVFASLVCLLCFVLLVPNVAGQNRKACTSAEADQAFDEADQLKNWDELYRSFALFAQCDDGAIGEGYSDTVVRLLALHWEEIDVLAKLARTDKNFKRFVLRHIDATADADQLKVVADHAEKSCPAGQTALCREILRSVKQIR